MGWRSVQNWGRKTKIGTAEYLRKPWKHMEALSLKHIKAPVAQAFHACLISFATA